MREAQENYEKACKLYKKQYSRATEVCQKLIESGGSDAHQCLQPGMKCMQEFISERLAVCSSGVRDWELFVKMKCMRESGTITLRRTQCRSIEADSLYDSGKMVQSHGKDENPGVSLFLSKVL